MAPRAQECAVRPLLVVMCGLPGSGKSTLARRLSQATGALHWDKDALRELLFPVGCVAHDGELNDLCMELLYCAGVASLGRRTAMVILDGRPFAARAQRERAREAARQAGAALVFVHCSAPMELLRRRVRESHVAPDRNEDLLERVATEFEPMSEDVIRIDTSGSIDQALDDCLIALRTRRLIAESA